MTLIRPYRSRLLLPRELPFTDPRARRFFYSYRRSGQPPSPDPTGLVSLAADVEAYGATLAAAFRGQDITAAGGRASAWPAIVGDFTLTPAGDTLPAVSSGLVSLDDSQHQYFRDDGDAGLNVFATDCAIVVVARLTLSPTAGASPTLATLSDGATSGRLMLAYEDNTSPALPQTLASGTGDPWPQEEYSPLAGERRTFQSARWRDEDDFLYLRVSRNDAKVVAKTGAPLGATPSTRLTIGTNRSDPPDLNDWDFAQLTELAAVLLLTLDGAIGYPDALADRICDWCETYAGAS